MRILGVDIQFTATIEEWLGHSGPKISYGKQPLGNEVFFQSEGLLTQQGIESVDITVKEWGDTRCFFSVSNRSAFPFDIFAASFYLLTRYEEYLPHVKDSSGRYPASESLGYKNDFLLQPVVDIWAHKLKELLQEHFPELIFPKKKMLTHAIVAASEPFVYGQKGLFRNALGYVSDLFKFRMRSTLKRTQVILGLRADPYDTFKWMVGVSKSNTIKTTVFFLLGDALVFAEGISSHRKKFRSLIKFVADYKEVGLLFSFAALDHYELLKKEKHEMEEITNRTLLSTMNAEYLVNLPDVYRNLVELEVQRDYTMTYKNLPGFRAGTCTPFLFYDLDFEIKTPLTIHPIAATTKAFLGKTDAEIVMIIGGLQRSVNEVSGTYSLLFSNKDFLEGEQNKLWRGIFSEITS